ncbi:MAG: orotate phosphoribosyltransferase [Bacteroidales bacterium]
MKKIETIIAEHLLQIKAIKLEPAKPFLWASGWNSPIYCDNRLILSYPVTRKLVINSFVGLIKENYPDVTLIAGVATGAIAYGAIIADKLDLPFAYVRPAPKTHGLSNMVEGRIQKEDRVVVIEDLVSTGNSSLSAVKALRSVGCEVLGMLAIFTYNFDIASENFWKNDCKLETLTNYNTLIKVAGEKGIVGSDQLKTLGEWRKNPAGWQIK